MKLTDVAPIGTRTSLAFVCRRGGKGGLQQVESPEYPPNPRGEALRELRVSRHIGLRAAATELGLSPSDLGALERGSKSLLNDDEYRWALDTLKRMEPDR